MRSLLAAPRSHTVGRDSVEPILQPGSSQSETDRGKNAKRCKNGTKTVQFCLSGSVADFRIPHLSFIE
jgi:hypothetical protein